MSAPIPLPPPPQAPVLATPLPPTLTSYPPYSIPNPSLPSPTNIPLPSLRFPPHLREMGYGEDGPGGKGPWKIYRPEKLPRGWDKGTWVLMKDQTAAVAGKEGDGKWGRIFVAAEAIWMVLDMDGKTPIYLHPPICHPCSLLPPPASLATSSSTTSCDRRVPSCSRCSWESSLLTPSTPSPCCLPQRGEWELLLLAPGGEATGPIIPSGYEVPKVLVGGSGERASKRQKISTVSASEQADRDREREREMRELQRARKEIGQQQAQQQAARASVMPSVFKQPNPNSFYPPSSSRYLPPGQPIPTPTTSTSTSTAALPPPSPAPLLKPLDPGYPARLSSNDLRPPLSNVSGPAPVWASRRKGLTSALEYFQNPVATLGGTVDIGKTKGGLARMCLLEGDVGEGYVFWGTGKSLGTIVLPLGHPRKIRTPIQPTQALSAEPVIPARYQSPPPAQPPSPTPLLTDRLHKLHPSLDSPSSVGTGEPEAPEIAAMLLSHRARTPVALAVSQDYGVVPWCVPRSFIVLGWFWITDAWPEPVGPGWVGPGVGKEDKMVRWRFRFDWCNAGQTSHPWWETVPRNDFICLYQIRSGPIDSSPWEIYGPGVSPTETVKLPGKDQVVVVAPGVDKDMYHKCDECGASSVEVYSGKHYCVNELCGKYFVEPDTMSANPMSTRKIILRAPRNTRRITPQDLGLIIRPRPADGKQAAEVDPRSAGRDLWKGWCCDRCGMANERRAWTGWDCEGCSQTFTQPRRIWKASELAPPLRPVSTGPRLDDGFPIFPSSGITKSSTIWEDGLKIVLHVMGSSGGGGTEIHHALAHSGYNGPSDRVFEALQASGQSEVPFRRVVEQGPHIRLCDVACSPFYTFLSGPIETPPIITMQSYSPMPWAKSPQVSYTGIEILNRVAGRIIDGEKEFNSLLWFTMPTNMPSVHMPWIPVPPFSSYAFLCLGSDGQISFKQPATDQKKREKGSATMQHGDVVMIRTYENSMEVGLSLKGFGFFALARQVYPKDPPRKATLPNGTPVEPLVMFSETPIYVPLPEPSDDPEPLADVPEVPVEAQGWKLGSIEIWGDKWPETKVKVLVEEGEGEGSRRSSVAAK